MFRGTKLHCMRSFVRQISQFDKHVCTCTRCFSCNCITRGIGYSICSDYSRSPTLFVQVPRDAEEFNGEFDILYFHLVELFRFMKIRMPNSTLLSLQLSRFSSHLFGKTKSSNRDSIKGHAELLSWFSSESS